MSDSTSASISIVPLTTLFTPPPDCSTSWTFEASDYNDVNSGLLIQNALLVSLDSSCFPSGFSRAGRSTSNDLVFSPGACPEGYTTNTGAITVDAVTTASCCLSDYYYLSSAKMQGCISTYTGTTFVAARAGGLGTAVDFTSSATASGTIDMWAQPITVMHRESDLSLYTTTSPAPTGSSTDLPAASSSSTGLSGGAKAGIAVGSVAGAFLLLGLAFVFWRRWSKNKQNGGGQNASSNMQDAFGGDAVAKHLAPSELDSRSIPSELRDSRPAQSHPSPSELAG